MLHIDPQTIHVWVLDLARITEQPDLLNQYRPLLSEDEATRLSRFAFPNLQQHYLATRAMVRTCLSHYADVAPQEWRFGQHSSGKPYLLNSPIPLAFNLSHSGERAVLAITPDRQIGIDVEQVSRKRDWFGIAEHYFHGDEVEALQAAPEALQHLHFFRLWTLKEAYLKARGTGIATGLDKAAFTLTDGKVRATFAADLGADPAEWNFFNYSLGDEYCLALASHCPKGEPAPQLQFYQSWPLHSDATNVTLLDTLTSLSEVSNGDPHLA